MKTSNKLPLPYLTCNNINYLTINNLFSYNISISPFYYQYQFENNAIYSLYFIEPKF